jgi:hypothetical protein
MPSGQSRIEQRGRNQCQRQVVEAIKGLGQELGKDLKAISDKLTPPPAPAPKLFTLVLVKRRREPIEAKPCDPAIVPAESEGG